MSVRVVNFPRFRTLKFTTGAGFEVSAPLPMADEPTLRLQAREWPTRSGGPLDPPRRAPLIPLGSQFYA